MGQMLGRYELIRPVAQGGMATVYLARVSGEGGFERRVALKLMHAHIANQPQFVTMFLDEARLAARIHHPNVVPTLAIERSAEGLFLVMEYVEGHALHAVLRAAGRARAKVPLPIVLRILIDALEGLHAAHELRDNEGNPLNLVHRDVSPQNVLVGNDGVSKITDFGVAHARARLTTTQGAGLKGKIAYLAPEQVSGGGIDRRADLFPAGIVLWELLTSKRLFRGDTEAQTIAAILAGPSRAPHEVSPEIPRAISDACMHALNSAPASRYSTALEFVEALEAAARHSGIEIAKPREVGAWVTRLGIPESTLANSNELMPSSSTGAITSAQAGSAGTGGSVAAPLVASMPPRKTSRRPLALLVLGLVACAGVAFGVFRYLNTARVHAAALAPAAEPEATPVAAIPPVVVATASAPPVVEAPSASASSAALPAESSSPKRPSPHVSVRPARPSATGYRPEGL